MRTGRIATGMALAFTTLPASAWATHADLFGWGPESVAQAGTGAATATDASAVFLNPAGLAMGAHSTLTLTGTWLTSALSINGGAHAIPEHWAVGGGLSLVPQGDAWLARHVAAGVGLYALPDTVIRITAGYPADPTFPYYDNRTQRAVIIPAVAVRITPWLAVGAGANVFAGLHGPASAVDGPTRAVEASLSESIPARAGLIAGVRLDPWPGWSLGLTYRQQFDVPYQVTTRNRVGAVPLDLTVSAAGLFTPDELVLAAAFHRARWGLTAEGRYARWSAWTGPYVAVQATLTGLDLAPPAVLPGFHDTLTGRVGGWFRVPYGSAGAVTLRAGLGWEPAITGVQSGRTNLLDGDRWIVSAGASVDLPRVWGVTGRLTLGAQVHLLQDRTATKVVGSPVDAARDPLVLADEDASLPGTQTRNPGYPSITGGGAVLTAVAGLAVDL